MSSMVNIKDYTLKLSKFAKVYFAEQNDYDIGMVAFYFDIKNNKIFITSISVLPDYQKKGIGKKLLEKVKSESFLNNIDRIDLEVQKSNIKAIKFYLENKFSLIEEKENSFILRVPLLTQ